MSFIEKYSNNEMATKLFKLIMEIIKEPYGKCYYCHYSKSGVCDHSCDEGIELWLKERLQ